ncbi:MAG: putative 4-mercaptohistidine N1-methyltransferase [Puniceicoccaceae bacterium]|nr:MAG: putative 4-mercaptohistidine N1-methyltransferase [Puniceicoccaceae bacterium]
MSAGPYYESDAAVAQYLLFHYGRAEEVLPWPEGPHAALEFPARCVHLGFALAALPAQARALDLGCATGRSSFELSRSCAEVLGVDFSRKFIAAAERIRDEGETGIDVPVEGRRRRRLTVRRPAEARPERVRFAVGDAMRPDPAWGAFDAVLMANLVDRLPDPAACLRQIPALVRPGGQLVLTSPYTWLEEYTAPDKWLGGHPGGPATLEVLKEVLAPAFTLQERLDLPFLIPEHDRKYQWSMAEATRWIRHPD